MDPDAAEGTVEDSAFACNMLDDEALISADDSCFNMEDDGLESIRGGVSDGEDKSHIAGVESPIRSSGRNRISVTSSSDGQPSPQPKEESKRKFRINNLRYPGEWMTDQKIQWAIGMAQSCHMLFSRVEGKSYKEGGMSMVFETSDEARRVFNKLKKTVVDGTPIKLQASAAFYEPSERRDTLSFFTIPQDESRASKTIYVTNLTPATDDTLLKNLIEGITEIAMLPMGEKIVQAEVVTSSAETARSAKEDLDKFDFSDGTGAPSRTIQVLTPPEYVEWVKKTREEAANPHLHTPTRPTPPTITLSLPQPNKPSSAEKNSSHAGKPTKEVGVEPTTEELDASLKDVVSSRRVNWAEIDIDGGRALLDLYGLLDQVSSDAGGVHDSLLQATMLRRLEEERGGASNWMRKHLETLIKMWKKEMGTGLLFERASRVPLQSRTIAPVPLETTRKRGRRGGVAARVQMGVGAVLADARVKFATEEGELDIEEDDGGNVLIGGEALSFDMWAKFNRTSLKRPLPVVEKAPQPSSSFVHNRKAKRAKAGEDRKMQKETKEAGEERPPKELDEGEIDSEEERGSESASSSDTEDEGRGRRRFRKKTDKTSMGLPPLFQNLYDNRVEICAKLSQEHQMAFTNILTQIRVKQTNFSSDQRKEMAAYMARAFGGS